MRLTSRDYRRIALVAAIMLVVPLAIFPNPMGLQLARVSASNVVFEFVFYGVVAWLINRELSLLSLAKAAAASLGIRLACGAVTGLVIVALYGMNTQISFALAMFSYLPAVVLHTLLVPVLLYPYISQMAAANARRLNPRMAQMQAGGSSIAISREHGIISESVAHRHDDETASARPSSVRGSDLHVSPHLDQLNGFERAVRYIGEHGSTFLAAVVDGEGLLLANFKRGNHEPEDWAPLALLFQDANKVVLRKVNLPAPERVDVVLKDRRIIVARDEQFTLLIVAERHSDDTLGIRTAQALEMIRKYMAERYGQKADLGAERVYVSGTK